MNRLPKIGDYILDMTKGKFEGEIGVLIAIRDDKYCIKWILTNDPDLKNSIVDHLVSDLEWYKIISKDRAMVELL